eukprot:gene7068-13145_t
MQQFSNAGSSFNAASAQAYKTSLPLVALRKRCLVPTTIDLSDRGAADGTATTTTITTVAAAAATRFKRMIAAQPPSPDTSPLSDRLLSIKQVLNICLQTDLSISPTDIDEAAGVIKVPSMSRGSGAAAAAGGGLFGAAEPAP